MNRFENFADAEDLLMVAICSAWKSSVGNIHFTPTPEDHFYFEGFARGVYLSSITLFQPAEVMQSSFNDDLEYLITLSGFKCGVNV
jgi:hypothetical protein